MTFNAETHLQHIEESLAALLTFAPRTAAPAHVAHQYVGTVIDNTLAHSVAAANSLDGGTRTATFSESRNWESLLQAVHRLFFASMHLAIERGLNDVCEAAGVEVQSSTTSQFDREYDKLLTALEIDSSNEQAQRFKKKCRPRAHPTFDDHLNAALKLPSLNLPRETQQTWRSFFRALSIVRNKASHSDPTLSSTETADLAKGGCAAMVSSNDTLVLNVRMHTQVVERVLSFLDLVVKLETAT